MTSHLWVQQQNIGFANQHAIVLSVLLLVNLYLANMDSERRVCQFKKPALFNGPDNRVRVCYTQYGKCTKIFFL